MGAPIVRNNRYVDPLPNVVIPLTSGGRRTIRPNRTLVVSFGIMGVLLRGHVDLRGPVADPNIPDAQENIVRSASDASRGLRANIQMIPFGGLSNRFMAAEFTRAADQFPAGYYDMTVTITAPNNIKPRNQDGSVAGNLVYSRRVWVQFDLIQQTRVLPGEGEQPAARPASARPQDIGVVHKGVVIGDPLTLELAYLLQFGREFPQMRRAVNYRVPNRRQISGSGDLGRIGFQTGTGAQANFRNQFALYHGAVKKANGRVSLLRNVYRMVQDVRSGARARRFASAAHDAEQMLPPPNLPTRPNLDARMSRAWLDDFATMANAGPTDIRMAMNHVHYGECFEAASGDRELLTRLFPSGQPPQRLGQGLQALDYFGKMLDVIDIGLNAINYGEHCRRGLQARDSLFGAIRTMYNDKAFSIFRLMEIESFRHTWVRRGAQAIEMLRSAPTALLGFIPVGGWILGIAGFLAGQMESLTRDAVVDWLEDNFNAWMTPTQWQQLLATQSYQQAFGGTDEDHTAQRMLIQLSIRAKLLYDLKELVDGINPDGDSSPGFDRWTLLSISNAERIRMANILLSFLMRKGPWFMHKSLVFHDNESYLNLTLMRMSAGSPAREWIPVHFQEYFPIDCYSGDVRQFVRRFHEGHDLKLDVNINSSETDRFEIRFARFHETGFINRVWAFVYAMRPPMRSQFMEDFSGREQDVRRRDNRVWVHDLTEALRQTTEALEQPGTFEDNIRRVCLWVYCREEGESEEGESGPVPHLTRDGSDYVALCYPRPSGITNHFDFNRHAYLFLLLTNIRGQIVFSKFQYYVGSSSVIGTSLTRFDVQGSYLVRQNQRIRFR